MTMRQFRFFCYLLLFGFLTLTANAQFPNDWITYTNTYHKFPVFREGIHRISYSVLNASGINTASLDPRNIQIYARGAEIPLYIAGESDGVFDPQDYIEFYAKGNDGFFDGYLYDTLQNQFNEEVSLFNDTIYYFLTWNNSIANQRFVQETDTQNFAAFAPEPFCWKINRNAYNNYYAGGLTSLIATTDPEYSKAEGWGSPLYSQSAPRNEVHITREVFTSGPPATFSGKFCGASQDFQFQPDQLCRISFPSASVQWPDISFDGYQSRTFNYSIPPNQLSSVTSSFLFESIPVGANGQQYQSVAYTFLRFPHTFSFENLSSFQFNIPLNTTQLKSHVQFNNLGGSGGVICYDITNAKRIPVVPHQGGFRFLSPNLGNEKTLLVLRESAAYQISQLFACGNNGIFTDYSADLFAADYLVVYPDELASSLSSFVNLKSTQGFSLALLNVEQVYDQFGYGIPKHPGSIRKIAHYAHQLSSGKTTYLLLAGKAISSELIRQSPSLYAQCLVPSIGYPASDNLLTSRYPGAQGYEPLLATGRIAARNDAEFQAYTNKLIQHHAQPDDLWMKRILHFAGGFDVTSQAQIKYYLSQYERILEDTLFGGDVTIFSKTSTAPIQITASDSITNLIESGIGLMTFFGHAAGSGFDQNIDNPDVYNWNGRYPLLVANSCFVGNIHLPLGTYISASEDYVLSPGVGTIGFLAQVGSGLPSVLYSFTQTMFRHLSVNHYGKGVGFAVREAVRELQPQTYDLLKQTCLEMTFHGDPSVGLYSGESPDYRLRTDGWFTVPAQITTAVDSFALHIVADNLSRALNDSIILEVKRFLPNGQPDQVIAKTIHAPYYRDTIVFYLKTNQIAGSGLNAFEAFIDASQKIVEPNELNNRIRVNFFIRSDEILPVYPYEFAIIDKPLVVLRGSTNDPLASLRNYRFQLDTNNSFSNPLVNTLVSGSGGVISYPVPFSLTDSTVYYWRVTRDTLINGGYRWRNSSFQYISGKTGWAQAHFNQFENDGFTFIDYNKPDRRFDYVPNSRQLSCRTYSAVFPGRPTDTELYATEYRLDTEVQDYAGCQYIPAFHVAVIDSLTLKPWEKFWVDNSVNPPVVYNPNNNFGNANNGSNCRNQPEKYFIFRTNSAAQLAGMKNMLLNEVPVGNYILIYTWIRGNFQSLADTTLISALESLGADSVRFLPNQKAYIFFVKKGYPQTAEEVISPGAGSSEITFSKPLTSNWFNGLIDTPPIGPALQWNNVSWYENGAESPDSDSTFLRLFGQQNNGQWDTLFQQILSPNQFDFPLSSISAAQYPMLRLQMQTADNTLFTPAQLKRWQIFYEEVPEAAVDPARGFSFTARQMSEGQPGTMQCAVSNISRLPMDSMLVKFWIEDKNKVIHPLGNVRFDSLRVTDTIFTRMQFSTLGLDGNNVFWMECNPYVNGTMLYDQPEQYHFNNYLQVPFQVQSDKINPVLDVTFDGVRILNDDIVSPKPEILITVNDENRFLLLRDTSDVALYLRRPERNEYDRVWFSGSGIPVTFIPASSGTRNTATIRMQPSFAEDGKYRLRVQATDASNNKSGLNDYEIGFEVISQSSITEVMNYPNPFSSRTRFVFTLTGSEIPDRFDIRIMTISGKVVREISKDELGTIRIGRNISDYEWDGTDQFGDKLAPGVYLYKVSTSLDGEAVKKRETAADQYFKKGWGKLVIIR